MTSQNVGNRFLGLKKQESNYFPDSSFVTELGFRDINIKYFSEESFGFIHFIFLKKEAG